jgi:hypothetical protein
MLTMDTIKDIRFRFFVKGEKIAQIAKTLNLDWKTVQKYVDMNDFNESSSRPASEQRFCPKPDPYKPTIDKWLVEDKQAPRKQRHTAMRVYNRLKKEFPLRTYVFMSTRKKIFVPFREQLEVPRTGMTPIKYL